MSSTDKQKMPTLRQFHARFPDEAACAAHLFKLRYPEGYICMKCGSRKAWPVRQEPAMMICDQKHKISITAGTTLHRTKQPLEDWFDAYWLMLTNKSGISVLQLMRQLGSEREETTALLMHKMRAALWDPHRSRLHGMVECDEVLVGGRETGSEHAGRGAATKTLVAIAVEVRKWQDEKGDEHTMAGRARMEVVPDASGKTLLPFIERNVEPGATVKTDTWAGYTHLAEQGYAHEKIVAATDPAPLPTHGRVTTNLKRVLIGTYKGSVSRQHLQAYLNEYVFRFNRRHWPWAGFDRALSLAMLARDRPEYKTLYGGQWLHRSTAPRAIPRVKKARANPASPIDEINAAIVRQLELWDWQEEHDDWQEEHDERLAS